MPIFSKNLKISDEISRASRISREEFPQIEDHTEVKIVFGIKNLTFKPEDGSSYWWKEQFHENIHEDIYIEKDD